MLRVSEESFNQGVRQVTFFHGVSAEDSRYDLGKDVVNGQLVPLGDDTDGADQAMEDQPIETTQLDESIEII